MPRYLFVLILLLVCSRSSLAQLDLSKSKLEIEKLDSNIYLYVQNTNIANPSSVVYTTPNFSVLIDPGFKQMQPIIRDSISGAGGGKVGFIMATHFHTDHAQAMEEYYNHTSILLSKYQFDNAAAEMDISNVIVAEGTYQLKLGNEVLEIHTMPNAGGHTGEDALFYFKKSNVLVVGDYLFQGMYPIIDTDGGGSISGYFENINYILALADNKTKIIPGHTSFKAVQNRYLSKEEYQIHITTLQQSIAIINNMKQQGFSVEEAIEKGLPERYASFNEGIKYVSEERWIRKIYESQ